MLLILQNQEKHFPFCIIMKAIVLYVNALKLDQFKVKHSEIKSYPSNC